MTTINAAAVKELRDRTSLSMMECKNALVEAEGDMNKAIDIIKAKMGRKLLIAGERETAEGRIFTFIDAAKNLGVILELRCESAPVAKAEAFVALGNELAAQIAATNPATPEALLSQPLAGKTVSDRITDAYSILRENMKVQRFARFEGVCGEYVHHDGSLGVLLQVSGTPKDAAVLRNVCMHVAAYVPTPLAARKEDLPADLVAKEMAAAREKAASTGKPANIVEKIAEGQLRTWYSEVTLVEQPFVQDDTKKVGEVLKGIGVEAVTFVRYKVGALS